MARPVSADAANKIIIHTNGGHRYASTKTYTADASGKKRYVYKHWGTVDEGNKFHPNANYFYAPVAERLKLIFPKEWDLSEAEKLSGLKHRGRMAYEADDVDRQYGATWLLDRVADVTGVREDLMKAFGGNAEMVNDILTMAYFPFVDNLSYSHLAQWQREVKSPSERKLTSTLITRLTQDITERNRMDLFRCRAARMGRNSAPWIPRPSPPTGSIWWTSAGGRTRSICRCGRRWKWWSIRLRPICPSTTRNCPATCPTVAPWS